MSHDHSELSTSASGQTTSGSRRTAIVAALLAIATVALYFPCALHDFITFDDTDYVVRNSMVNSGLTWEGLKWAFIQVHASNWHPLTWLSHMLDCQFYALHPAGHHLTSVAFHAANSVLLFLALNTMTRAVWRSAVVAALFAFHPMHVESVAWVAERKDVLSTFFLMLTLVAYSVYARERGGLVAEAKSNRTTAGFYVLAVVLFLFGLMSKPMLVTVPIILCLLDYWPLARLNFNTVLPGSGLVFSMLREKIPFAILAAASCVVTVVAQRSAGSTMSLQALPLDWRIGNALVAYCLYLIKMIWPAKLAILYPLTGERPLTEVLGATLLLLSITMAGLWQLKRLPYLFIGWAWFVITLIPVIGLVQVGNQSLADRYTYIPSIGLFLMAVWGLADLTQAWRFRTPILAGSGAVVLVLCACGTHAQLAYWKNTEALFQRALAVTTNNYVAYNNLGFYYSQHGRLEDAARCYEGAIAINPNSLHAWHDYAVLLANQKQYDEAIEKYQRALQINPQFVSAINNLGNVYLYQGRIDDALNEFRRALNVDPDFFPARQNLATVLSDQGRYTEAAAQYEVALRLDPHSTTLQADYAKTLARLNRLPEAEVRYREVLKLDPKSKSARLGLAAVLGQQGNGVGAMKLADSVLQDFPKDPDAHYQVAVAANTTGNTTVAVQHYLTALELVPDFPEALNNLAWIRATSAYAQFRNGTEAVRLATRACELTHYKEAVMIGTLAAAYAEDGKFAEAVASAEQARTLAEESKDSGLVSRNEELASLYRSKKPFRDIH